MNFPISAALLDAIVLSVVAQEPEGTYGYKITQQVTHTLELSESTLYPVLRRPQPPLLPDHRCRAAAACRLCPGVEPLPFFH